jgi:hypothetical protein
VRVPSENRQECDISVGLLYRWALSNGAMLSAPPLQPNGGKKGSS